MWFLLFWLASIMCKVAMKRLGLTLDRGKVGTCSMFFVAGKCGQLIVAINMVYWYGICS